MRDTNSQERGEGKGVQSIAIKSTQQLGTETNEGDYFGPDTRLDRPLAPFLYVHLEVDVNETVPQRRGHPRRSGTVRIPIAGGDNRPSFR